MKWHIWNHVVSKKSVKWIKIHFIFGILKIKHPLPWWQLCTHLAFPQPASPGMLFQQSWRSSHICWALVGCFYFTRPTHPKPSQLGLGRVTVKARVSDAALHHSPSWSNIPYTAWRCVASLSCWKTNDSPTKCKPDLMAYHCRMMWLPFWLSMPWILNNAEIILSPTLRLTKTSQRPKISNLDSSESTDFHWSNVHCSCFLAQASLFFLLVSFSRDFFAAIRPWRPDSHNLLWTVDVEICLLLEQCEAFI